MTFLSTVYSMAILVFSMAQLTFVSTVYSMAFVSTKWPNSHSCLLSTQWPNSQPYKHEQNMTHLHSHGCTRIHTHTLKGMCRDGVMSWKQGPS